MTYIYSGVGNKKVFITIESNQNLYDLYLADIKGNANGP